MFRIHIHDGSEIPNDDIMYIIGKKGIFLRKKLGLIDSLAPVDKISILEDVDCFAQMDIKPISIEQTGQIVSFFRHICKEFGEANVVLHYNSEEEDYIIQVTDQEVTGASVDYVNEVLGIEGYQRIGTIHSHSRMSAFHSGTDHKDEENFDGLHITLGSMNDDYISISASIMANGMRFYVDPCQYMDGVEMLEVEEQSGINKFINSGNKIRYSILATDEQSIFPEEWLDKVKKKVFKTPTYMYARNQSIIDRFKQFGGFENHGHIDKIGDDTGLDWDPCMNCPYKSHKSDMMLKEILEEMDDEELDSLGFEDDDEKDDEKGDDTWLLGNW